LLVFHLDLVLAMRLCGFFGWRIAVPVRRCDCVNHKVRFEYSCVTYVNSTSILIVSAIAVYSVARVDVQ
jgi:hypothetical protein